MIVIMRGPIGSVALVWQVSRGVTSSMGTTSMTTALARLPGSTMALAGHHGINWRKNLLHESAYLVLILIIFYSSWAEVGSLWPLRLLLVCCL